MEVKIFTTPTCGYCKMAKQLFDENNIKYTEVDVAADEKARDEMIERSGQMSVPVIEIDGELIIGFDREALEKGLEV